MADAAVVGINIHNEEMPRAYVVLQEGVKISIRDVQDFISQRVAKHKHLKGGIKFVAQVPKFASGKIVRKVIKEWAKADAKEVESTVKARI